MIRLWNDADAAALKALWRDTFGDPDFYIDGVIFKYKTTPESVILMERGGALVSAVHMPVCGFSFWGGEHKASYVMGVATDRAQRGHGYMRPLMEAALRKMYESGTAFCTLIPAEDWLYDYYARFGFFEAFYLEKNEVYINKKAPLAREVSECGDDDELYRFYSGYFKDEPFHMKKSRRDFAAVLTDHRLGKGHVLVHKTDGAPDGMCFAIGEGSCLIKELCARDPAVREALISRAGELCGADKADIISRPSGRGGANAYRRGMIRAVRFFDALSSYAAAHPDESLTLSVRDGDISENSGRYSVRGGRALKLSDAPERDALTPAQAMAFLLKGQTCYMNMMLD